MTTDYLMTVDQLRGYIMDTAESDVTLQERIDNTAAELDVRFGALVIEESSGGTAPAEVIETVRAWNLSLLPLKQVPAEVVEVVDTIGTTDTTLVEDDDWRIRGRHLERANGYRWGQRTAVTYVPADTTAARRRVLVELIRLDMAYMPGLGSQSGGAWSESYFGKSYLAEREAIMATLGPSEELFA